MSSNGSNRGKALAEQFRHQTAKALNEHWTAEVKLPIPSIAPDFIFEFIAQRVDITSLLYNGELPESFAKQILEQREQNQDQVKKHFLADSTPEEKQATIDFQIMLAQKVCKSPKLIWADANGDDEVDMRLLPFSGNLIIALNNYAMGLSPDVPVATTDGGATSLKAVETFHESAPRHELSGAVPDSQDAKPAGLGSVADR